jgi:DNA-binding response OmpR family regulator
MEKIKILLIDDNIDMLLIGQRIFERAGYEFFSARSGQEGLDKVLEIDPGVIVLDYMLPDISGTDFIKKVSSESEYEKISGTPIVILTARPNYADDFDSCYEMGLRAYLYKPFGHRELVNVIDNIVRIARLQATKSKPALVQQPTGEPIETPPEIDSKWLEDIRIATGTISSLCRELSLSFTGAQKLEVEAIYNSSKRLVRLVNGKNSPDI